MTAFFIYCQLSTVYYQLSTVYSLPAFSKHSAEHSFFKFPEKAELPEDESIEEQQDIVKRKYENVIQDRK